MKPIGDMQRGELLDFAHQRIFSLGPRDLASALAHENMKNGIGKMMYALDNEDVFCLFGPDATITRNIGRWMSGFGYGAVIRWPDEGVFFPELRPNSCGMVIAKLDELPPKKEIIEQVSNVEDSDLSIDGIKITPDFGKGNHFFEFYKVLGVSPDIEKRMPEECNYAILHGSGPERKNEVYGMIDQGEWIKTPLGEISVLDGELGKKYYRTWNDIERFSKRRRELLAREVLGECEIISNLTHQGLFARNEIRLGCHDTMDKSYPPGEALFPVALRWDIPMYIFRGEKNISDEVMGRTGLHERTDEVGMTEEMRGVNILPHGGGYKIDLEYTSIEVIKTAIGNNFVLSGAKPVSRIDDVGERHISSFGEMIIMNPRELPFDYRGKEIIEKIMEYNLGDPVAKLQPLMTIKI